MPHPLCPSSSHLLSPFSIVHAPGAAAARPSYLSPCCEFIRVSKNWSLGLHHVVGGWHDDVAARVFGVTGEDPPFQEQAPVTVLHTRLVRIRWSNTVDGQNHRVSWVTLAWFTMTREQIAALSNHANEAVAAGSWRLLCCGVMKKWYERREEEEGYNRRC